MCVRGPGWFILICILVGGCQKQEEANTDDSQRQSSTQASESSIGVPVGSNASADPMSIEATPAREFCLAWVGNIGALEDDPLDRQQVRIRGNIARIAPAIWFGAQHLNSPKTSVWLYGEAINWADKSETWIQCEFDDVVSIQELRSGQTVVIEGRYRQSPMADIRVEKCQLLAVGAAPKNAAKPLPFISMKKWQDTAKKLDEFRSSNQFDMDLNEMRGLLVLELGEGLFEESEEFPQDALDVIARFPIDAVECAGDGAKQLLVVIDRFPRLRELSFQGNLNCSSRDIEKLKEVKYLESLNFLECDSVNDEFVASIAGLTFLRSIKLEKGLGRYQLTDAGLASLAKLDGLRSLEFYSNDNITDESLSHISTLPKLRQLSVWDTSPFQSKGGISDQGFAALPRKSLPDLLFLNLMGQSKVTNAGIESLIKQDRHLASLDLERTGVTDDGLKRIIEAKLSDRIIGLPQEMGDEVRQQLVEAEMIRE